MNKGEIDCVLSHNIRRLYQELKMVSRLHLDVGRKFEKSQPSREYTAQMSLLASTMPVFFQISEHLVLATRHHWDQFPPDLSKGIEAIEQTRKLLKGSGRPYKMVSYYATTLEKEVRENSELSNLLTSYTK